MSKRLIMIDGKPIELTARELDPARLRRRKDYESGDTWEMEGEIYELRLGRDSTGRYLTPLVNKRDGIYYASAQARAWIMDCRKAKAKRDSEKETDPGADARPANGAPAPETADETESAGSIPPTETDDERQGALF